MLEADAGANDVRHAATQAEALSMIPPSDTPTCVLLDLSLPGAEGVAGLEGLHRFAPHAAVVVLTGDEDAECFRALATGAQDYLVKSRITPEILSRTIRHAVAHKSSQAALFDIAERVRLTFEESPMGMALITVRPDEGARIIDANAALASILGRDIDALVGMGILDFVDPSDAGAFALELKTLGSGAQERHPMVGKDGEVLICAVTSSVLRDSAGEAACVVAMFKDVTVQVVHAEELHQALDALDKAAYGIALLDVSGRFVSLNRAHAAVLGYEEQELVGTSWQSIVHVDDQELVRDAIARASAGGAQHVEMRAVRNDGSVFDARVELVASNDPDGSLRGVHSFLSDISERKSAERALQSSEAQYRHIVETTNEAVWITDSRGCTTFVNTRMCEMLGAEEEALLGTSAVDLVVVEDQLSFLAAIESPGHPISKQRDIRFRHANGHLVWGLLVTSPLEPDGGTLAMVTDITDRKRAEIELAHIALHDGLTGLPNRTLLVDRLRQALVNSVRSSCTVGVFFIDLDRFKSINDSLGHETGDIVLQAVATRMQSALRGADTLGRLGGDEFVVLCPELASEHDAAIVVERLLVALAEPVETGTGPVSISASVGIAVAHGDETPAEDLLGDADTAMYRAKERGGATYEFFDTTMRAELVSELRLEREIREALRLGEFSLAYQPILNVADQSVAGFEALIRWHHPDRGVVPPLDFIGVAERTGLIVPIGDWVILEVCEQMARWVLEASPLAGAMAWVNVSARQFDDPTFPATVSAILAETGVEASRLCFEVTETALVDLRSQTVPRVMRELRDMGVQLVLDDFGTGFSSLNYIRRLPIVGLKLDRSFVSQMGTDEVALPIVEAVAGMARSLGLSLVAEGVETQEQLDAVAAHGCGMAQGFFFARPMPAAELSVWVGQRSVRPVGSGRQPDRLTVGLGEAADHLGVSVSTVRRWADCGRLPSVRTAGGHRRIYAADVRREARRLAPGVELNVASAPFLALSALEDLIASRGESILAVVAKRVYSTGIAGWFGADISREARSTWASALRDGCRTGDYADVMEASTTFLRRAVVGGTTALERHLFLERVRATFDHLLRQSGAPPEQIAGARSLMMAIEQQAFSLT
jgi:diguanylate cyclase (GGDEF)-like protein/PAS domain S-box-containing protein/excisionase family DNA binding protein